MANTLHACHERIELMCGNTDARCDEKLARFAHRLGESEHGCRH